MSYTVTTKNCWYNDYRMIVKMFFLNDVPFTFDDLPVGYFYDREIVKEADNNKEYSVEDFAKKAIGTVLSHSYNITINEVARAKNHFLASTK